MKNSKKLKAMMLLLAMAGMLLPTTMSAQSDGFFRGGEGNYENRANEQGQFTFEEPAASDPTAPVGSGLLIMLCTGAGYALLKKKED